ncbi:MAG: hypothetical protein P8Y25_12920 [Chromatiaceae bacterium]
MAPTPRPDGPFVESFVACAACSTEPCGGLFAGFFVARAACSREPWDGLFAGSFMARVACSREPWDGPLSSSMGSPPVLDSPPGTAAPNCCAPCGAHARDCALAVSSRGLPPLRVTLLRLARLGILGWKGSRAPRPVPIRASRRRTSIGRRNVLPLFAGLRRIVAAVGNGLPAGLRIADLILSFPGPSDGPFPLPLLGAARGMLGAACTVLRRLRRRARRFSRVATG